MEAIFPAMWQKLSLIEENWINTQKKQSETKRKRKKGGGEIERVRKTNLENVYLSLDLVVTEVYSQTSKDREPAQSLFAYYGLNWISVTCK